MAKNKICGAADVAQHYFVTVSDSVTYDHRSPFPNIKRSRWYFHPPFPGPNAIVVNVEIMIQIKTTSVVVNVNLVLSAFNNFSMFPDATSIDIPSQNPAH